MILARTTDRFDVDLEDGGILCPRDINLDNVRKKDWCWFEYRIDHDSPRDKNYTMRQPDDDEYTPVTVWKDVIKDFGSEELVESVWGNVTKCIPDIWIYSRYLDTLLDT